MAILFHICSRFDLPQSGIVFLFQNKSFVMLFLEITMTSTNSILVCLKIRFTLSLIFGGIFMQILSNDVCPFDIVLWSGCALVAG